MSFSSDRVVVPFSAFLERRQQLEARAAASRRPNPDDPTSIRSGSDESESSDVRDWPGPDDSPPELATRTTRQ